MKNQTSSWKSRNQILTIIDLWAKTYKIILNFNFKAYLNFYLQNSDNSNILSCPVLAWPVLFRPNLACPVLAWPVLSWLGLSCSVLTWPVLFRPNLNCPVQSCPIPTYPVLSCPVLSCPVLSCPVLSCPIQFCPILLYSVLFCPILSYSVLFSPILSYPVLPCLFLSCPGMSYHCPCLPYRGLPWTRWSTCRRAPWERPTRPSRYCWQADHLQTPAHTK